jgi:hypothetical protein
MMQAKSLAFVAYASKDEKVVDAIQSAVHRANSLAIPVRYEPWIFNDIPGVSLVSPILSRIEESAFIVADITHLNLNVVFEIGYAIGRQRRVFLIRYGSVEGDKELAKEAGIFDTLGYFEYASADDLRDRLTGHIESTPSSFNQGLDHRAPMYIVESSARNSPSIMLTSRIKKAGYRYRSFNPAEDVRLSATDAIRQVSSSSGVAMLLQEETNPGAQAHNVRAMFVAGLASGMDKPILILAAAGFEAPLDVRDSVKSFRHPDDIVEVVAAFCPYVNSYAQQVEPPPIETRGLLQSLSIGDPTAENEMTTLGHYYLRTEQYQRAVRGEVNLVVGRKGSGKTALFIQVRDKIRSDKRNIVVDLKPEGYQLLKLKEDILKYLGEGSRQHLVTGFWEYLILLEVAYKILEKDKNTYKFNHEINDLYVELERTYRTEDVSVEGDFSERLSALSLRLSDEYQRRHPEKEENTISSEEVSKILYAHDIRNLKKRISEYLEKKESVWILFDNLDKGWSTQGVDVIDATVLRCLVDAGRKLEREMAKAGHAFRCIIFVRNDVYEHLMQNSADYGKEMRATLDWTDADLLKEMLRLRLISSLDGQASSMNFDALWRTVCASQIRGEDSANYVISRSLMRPRNVLKIFNHSRGFAANFNHVKIEEDDIEKGLKAYSQDLIIELDRELGDVSHEARDILYHFIDSTDELSEDNLRAILDGAGIDSTDLNRVVDFLLYYGVLGIRINGDDYFIYDTNYDLKPLKIRASRANNDFRYIINQAFWPALNVVKSRP